VRALTYTLDLVDTPTSLSMTHTFTRVPLPTAGSLVVDRALFKATEPLPRDSWERVVHLVYTESSPEKTVGASWCGQLEPKMSFHKLKL